MRYSSFLTADQKVQNVHASLCIRTIQFRIPTLRTADRDELFVLHVKQLGEVSARGLKLV